MTSKLLPCPFCGVTPEPFSYPKGSAVEATCNDEECPAFNIVVSIEAWNKRAAPETPRQSEPVAFLCKSEGAKWLQYHEKVGDPWKPGEVELTPLYSAPPSPDHSGGGAGVVLPSLWYIRVPDEPENDDSPCEYFYASSVYHRDLLLKKKGASVAIEYVRFDKVKELNQ